jgi:[ribosomal protein S18]-alanine N-acetyltransferase
VTPLIRRATEEDLQVLIEIEQESFARPHWDATSFLRYDCIVAEVDRQVAGFLVSRQILPAANGAPAEREILNIAVASRFRRLGIATRLLKQERRHRATHYLEVRESNTAARQLYEKIGFLEVGKRPDYYDFPIETAIVMQMK